MTRREVMQKLLALPVVGSVQEISDSTKCLVLTLREGYDPADYDLVEIQNSIQKMLKDAGSNAGVILLLGFDAKVVNG